MIDFKKIIAEVSYRSKKGYPDFNSANDVKILSTVLLENGFDRKFVVEYVREIKKINESRNIDPSKLDVSDIDDLRMYLSAQTGLDSSLVDDILDIYKSYSDRDKQSFLKNLRKQTLSNFASGGWKQYSDFFGVVATGSRGGMGRGEIQALLAIRDSRTGGIESGDLKIGNKLVEVKELDSSSEFNLGTIGALQSYDFTTRSSRLKEILVKNQDVLVNFLGSNDSNDIIKPIKNIASYGGGADRYSREMAQTQIRDQYHIAKFFNDFFKSYSMEDLSVISVENSKYYVASDEAKKIKPNTSVNINIQNQVSDGSEMQFVLKQLMQHPFIRDPKSFISDLNDIKENYFGHLDGIIVYESRNPRAYYYSSSDALKKFAVKRGTAGNFKMIPVDIVSGTILSYDFIKDQA